MAVWPDEIALSKAPKWERKGRRQYYETSRKYLQVFNKKEVLIQVPFFLHDVLSSSREHGQVSVAASGIEVSSLLFQNTDSRAIPLSHNTRSCLMVL